ncbi:MAG: FecR domain-containing protein [Gemmatimonadota bacterium]|nr:FecR domain-containing protein [Gemmatimonadota bacterium]
MPETLPRIDQEVVTRIRHGDEQALERVFRDRFPALVQEASSQLDQPVGVPRVVEGAFRRAWEERATFQTPEALDGFLHTAVREGAARERKRLATLHRLEAGAHVHVPAHATSVPTADEAWSHLVATLHAPPPDPTAAAHARAVSRHDTAHHVAEIGKRRVPVVAIAIGLVIAVLVGGPLWWATRRGPEAAATRALTSPDVRVVSTLPGQQASVTLLDGSRAALGADSKLVIAPDFGATVRAAKLEGAAVFTVAPGNRHPFQVRAGNASVTASGTTFGLRAYPGDADVTVVAREGSVTVKAADGTRVIAAGQGLVVTTAGVIRDATAADLGRALSWTEDRLVIADRPLRDALREMSRWYGYDIKVRDSTLLNRPVNVTAGLQSPRDAVAALERSGGLKFDYEDEGRTMVLRDAAAKPAKTK